jgi:outer membrane protein assembly factor BamB/serine/threonine protein kinase
VPPDDRTILEGSSPDESPSGGNPGDGSTIIEGASADSSTIIEGTQARAEAGFNLVPGGQFQGHTLLKPLQVTSGEADLWFIADAQGKEYVLKLYRYGIKPKEEITKKIRSLGYEHVVTIEESGEVSGRHFEILEKIEHGDLDEYADGKPLEEEKLKVVVEELGSALAHLHEAGIIHRDIKPANILVRTLEPLDLVMTDFGISSVSDVSLHMTSVNRTALYSAPEAINGIVAKGSDWWCAGIIFLKLLLGKHPLEGMTEQAITFQLVTKGVKVPEEISEDWQLLLKGLLTRDPDNRWAWGEVEQWLTGKRDIATQYEGDKKEEKSYRYQPYKFNGKEHYLAEELAVSLGEDWEAGKKDFARGMIRTWVEAQLADQDLTRKLYDLTEDEGLDGDEKLSAGLMVMATDLPMFWKGEVVSRDWLVGNPEATVKISDSKLLHYYDLHRAEDELKLGEIAGRVKEVVGDEELQGEERDLVVTLAVNPEHPLKLDEDIIDSQEWMAANPKIAVEILAGKIPDWQVRLTGKTSLRDAREHRKAWWKAIAMEGLSEAKIGDMGAHGMKRKLAGAGGQYFSRDRVDELILQSEEERESRFKALWQKFESGEYVGAKDEKLQALLNKGEVGPVEQLILICCDEELFLTAQEKYQLDSMEYLKGFGVQMDWGLAKGLIAFTSWKEIKPLWQEVLDNPLPATTEHPRFKSVINAQQAEYLDVVALVSAWKIAERREAEQPVPSAEEFVEKMTPPAKSKIPLVLCGMVGLAILFYAINGKTGVKLWEFEAGGSASPAIGSDGTVYSAGSSGKLYAINPKSGVKLWEFDTGGKVDDWISSPAIGSDGTVYVGSSDNKLYAINGKSGVKLWEFETGGNVWSSPAIGSDGTVYVGSEDKKLYAIKLNLRGVKLWEFKTGGAVYSSPAIGTDGTVYVGSYDKKLYAINGKSGVKLWEFETGGAVTSSPAIGSDGTVYVGSYDTKLYAINGKSGVKLWEFETGLFFTSVSLVSSSPAIGSDDTVYVGSVDNKLYAINGKSGDKLWEFETGGAVTSSPAIGSNGTVYVGSVDKKLYAIKTDSKGPAKSPWPMRGQNPQHTGRAP